MSSKVLFVGQYMQQTSAAFTNGVSGPSFLIIMLEFLERSKKPLDKEERIRN
jgi:hypothetical protein